MKYLVNVLLLAATALAAKPRCNADNCARAVTGTLKAMTATHFADCRSVVGCTVTPAASISVVTTTITAEPYPFTAPVTVTVKSESSSAISAVTNCPTEVPVYASACSGTARYSSACSCFGATGATTTLTPSTTTTTSTVTVTPTCYNMGLSWAYYPYFGEGQGGLQYDPAVVKTVQPEDIGTTSHIYVALGEPVYGLPLDENTFILNHRGYIKAPETGTYTLTGTNIDDVTEVWVGPLAYSGWNRDNGLQTLKYTVNGGNGSFTFDMIAGKYYPFRLVYRQLGGPLGLSYSVTAPSGLVLISGKPTFPYSHYVTKFSCDGIIAPPFPNFGQET